MNQIELYQFKLSIQAELSELDVLARNLPFSRIDITSSDLASDAMAEALFMRAFVFYEDAIERILLHYIVDKVSLSGTSAETFLSVSEQSHARRIIKAGFPFLNLGKIERIKEASALYLKNGWPIIDALSSFTGELHNCQKIRDRIAHKSIESINSFRIVQRSSFGTERPFDMSPGQFLRSRMKRQSGSRINFFIGIMSSALGAMVEPPILR